MHLREWIHGNEDKNPKPKEKIPKKTVKDFAKEIGYDASYISGLMTGTKKPTAKVIDKIKLVTGGKVSEKDWEGIVADPFKTRPKQKK